MDKVKQNIDLQEAIQRYNIEKSVVGTLAYNIDQNLQKGMSPDEAIENVLQKSKSMPIGTIHNGFKKIANGKWRKVSEHGMTKEEHEEGLKNVTWRSGKYANAPGEAASDEFFHRRNIIKLNNNDYSDEEVTGGEKKETKMSIKDLESKRPNEMSFQDFLRLKGSQGSYNGSEHEKDRFKKVWDMENTPISDEYWDRKINESKAGFEQAKIKNNKGEMKYFMGQLKGFIRHKKADNNKFKNTQKS